MASIVGFEAGEMCSKSQAITGISTKAGERLPATIKPSSQPIEVTQGSTHNMCYTLHHDAIRGYGSGCCCTGMVWCITCACKSSYEFALL